MGYFFLLLSWVMVGSITGATGFVVGGGLTPHITKRKYRSNLFLRTYFQTHELQYIFFTYRTRKDAESFTYNKKYYHIGMVDTNGNKFISEETYFNDIVADKVNNALYSDLHISKDANITYETLKNKVIITIQ